VGRVEAVHEQQNQGEWVTRPLLFLLGPAPARPPTRLHVPRGIEVMSHTWFMNFMG
jgi:hypothetical protein